MALSNEVLSKLRVELGLDSSKFVDGLADSAKQAKGFGAAMSAAGGVAVVGMAALAVGVTAVTAAMVGATRKMLDYSGSMVDMAARTGLSTAALQKFKFAAEQSGTSLETIVKGSKILERNLGEGSAETIKAVRDLGLSLASLREMSPDKALEAVLPRIAAIENAAKRSAIGAALLGKAFSELLPVGKDLATLTKRAQELGLVMSSDNLQAAEALGDSFGALGSVLDGLVRNIGQTITASAPLKMIVDGMTEAVAEFSVWVSKNQDELVALVNDGIVLATNAFALMLRAAYPLAFFFLGLADSWAIAKAALRGLINSTIQYIDVAIALKNMDLGAAAKAHATYMNEQRDSGKMLAAELERNNGVMDKALGLIGSTIDRADKFAASIGKAAEGQKKMGQETITTGAAFDYEGKAAEAAGTKIAAAMKTISDQVNKTQNEIAIMMAKKNGGDLAGALVANSLGAEEEINRIYAERKILQDDLAKLGQSIPPILDEQYALEVKLLRTKADMLNEQLLGDASFARRQKANAAAYNDVRARAAGFVDFMSAPKEIQEKILAGTLQLTVATMSWGDALSNVSAMFSSIGGKFGSSMSSIMNGFKGIGSAMSALKAAGSTDKGFSFGNLFKGGITNILGNIGAMGQIASMGVGIIKSVSSMFKEPSWKKVGKEAGATLGMEIGEELAKTIEKTSKEMKIGVKFAALLNLDKAMEQSGKEARTAGDDVLHLMAAIKNGAVPATEGMETLSRSFGMIADEARRAGRVGDASMVAIIKQARKLNMMTPEMQGVVDDAIDMAIEGVNKLSKAGAIGAGAFLATFNAAVKEKGFVAAAEAMQEAFKSLNESGAGDLLAPIAGIFKALADDGLRPIIEAADGLRMVLTGLADAGYMDIATFTQMGQAGQVLFDQMIAGGMDSADAIKAMAPSIQAAYSLAQQLGIPLTEDWQHLKDIAEQNGITFKTDPMTEMLEVLKAIAIVLGADIPAAADKAGKSIGAIGGGGGGVAVSTGAGGTTYVPGPANGRMPSYAGGSGGVQNFGTGTLAMLHGREGVYTEDQVASMSGGDLQSEVADLRRDINSTLRMLPTLLKGAMATNV